MSEVPRTGDWSQSVAYWKARTESAEEEIGRLHAERRDVIEQLTRTIGQIEELLALLDEHFPPSMTLQ